ncbi:RMD1 family protein [Cytophagaceae bacterium DM2B3-1]|uniref:RMD1 family protein n=1 Tax=Xanthocytophaga flava TaxID=3048013 RepID=A0AAE3QM60_9BACT|nr:RMD1 family protein [Xanthocytophaga flavus]MDJ1470679.1 RMD1 family protein [Xanthocytophaga flavus]MDJ1481500.1 RMD1 family protein [Xanthocytophaga flavus]MDJ1491478.1 RMD1 family protein [Xanthocytophaga flavus]
MLKVEAFQVAEQINIKSFRSEFTGEPYLATNYEVFYVLEHSKYLYVLNYGVVVFVDHSEVEKSDLIRFLKNFCERPVREDFKEDLLVEVNPQKKLTFNYTSLIVPEINEHAVRVIMLNTAQSVALETYESLGDDILEGTKRFAEELEKAGKVKISPKNLLRFIGRTINVKNSIIDNLYVFNSPDVVWESEYLSKLDHGLREMFDINTRFRALDYELRVVQDNLELFTDLLQNRESTRLEWIVIGLIFVEVLNLIFGKIFGSGH